MATGVSLATRGMITPLGGGGSEGFTGYIVKEQDELPKPFIKVTEVTFDSVTDKKFKKHIEVTSVKFNNDEEY